MADGTSSGISWISKLFGLKQTASAEQEPGVTSGPADAKSTIHSEIRSINGGPPMPEAGELSPDFQRAAPAVGARSAGAESHWLMAQAQTPPATSTRGTRRFTVDPATKRVILPDGTSLEAVEISGSDIIMRQPDGSVVIIENAIPQIFFHIATAYDILRHNGVPVGKRDYTG